MTYREIKKPKPTAAGADPASFLKKLSHQRATAESRADLVHHLFLCLLVFAIVFNFSETTLARGVLIPAQGDVEVRARESGTLVDFAVRPGQYVKENDPLFTVSQDYGGKQGSVVQFDRQQMEAEKKRSEQRIQAIEDSIASYRKIWRSSWLSPTSRSPFPAIR